MAIFGFGKKKNVEKSFPQHEPEKTDSNSNLFSLVNGEIVLNHQNVSEEQTSERLTNVKTESSSRYEIYSEDLDKFLARNDNAKLVKLTGKPEEFADYAVGYRCQIEEDDESDDKYNVICGGSIIGRLPASAISYAQKHDILPDCLVAIIADVDYDFEKDRDIISIYIAD